MARRIRLPSLFEKPTAVAVAAVALKVVGQGCVISCVSHVQQVGTINTSMYVVYAFIALLIAFPMATCHTRYRLLRDTHEEGFGM